MQYTTLTTSNDMDTVSWIGTKIQGGGVTGTQVPQSDSAGSAWIDSGGTGIYIDDTTYGLVTQAIETSPAFVQRFSANWFSTEGSCADLDETPQALDAELPTMTMSNGMIAWD